MLEDGQAAVWTTTDQCFYSFISVWGNRQAASDDASCPVETFDFSDKVPWFRNVIFAGQTSRDSYRNTLSHVSEPSSAESNDDIRSSSQHVTTYNWDAQLLLQVKSAKVLQMIVDSDLDPDTSRAARLSRELRLEWQENADKESPESGFEGAEVALINSEVHLEDRPGIPIGEPDEFTFMDSGMTETMHVLQDQETDGLEHGRVERVNMKGVEPKANDATTPPFCIQCNAVIRHSQT